MISVLSLNLGDTDAFEADTGCRVFNLKTVIPPAALSVSHSAVAPSLLNETSNLPESELLRLRTKRQPSGLCQVWRSCLFS